MTSSDTLNELQLELSRHKEQETTNSAYITQLETRLSKADADMASLRAIVEKLEEDAEKKDKAIELLEMKLEEALEGLNVKAQQEDIEEWKRTLDEREKKLIELEKRLEEWERVRLEAGEERERLGGLVDGVEQAKKSLQQEMALEGGLTTPFYTPAADFDRLSLLGSDMGGISGPTTPVMTGRELPDMLLAPSLATPTTNGIPSSPTASVKSTNTVAVRDQLLTLQKTHSDTLTDLSDVTSKYRDALREISELTAQITEAKHLLNSQSAGHSNPPSEPNSDVDNAPSERRRPNPIRVSPRSPPSSLVTSPTLVSFGGIAGRRRASRTGDAAAALLPPSTSLNQGTSRRLFFRHAASADSLHSRSQSQSQSSQEPSPQRPLITTSFNGPRESWNGVESLLSPTLPPKSPRFSLPTFPGEGKRSVDGLEKEIKRLQEVLKDRESEISALEKNLKEMNNHGPVTFSSLGVGAAGEGGGSLSVNVADQFASLRRSIELVERPGPDGFRGAEDSLARLNEVML